MTDRARPAIIIIVAASKSKTKELAGDDDIDAWLSLVERCVRDAEVARSNRVASTHMMKSGIVEFSMILGFFFAAYFFRFTILI